MGNRVLTCLGVPERYLERFGKAPFKRYVNELFAIASRKKNDILCWRWDIWMRLSTSVFGMISDNQLLQDSDLSMITKLF